MNVERIRTGPYEVNCYVLSAGTEAVVIDPGMCSEELVSYIQNNGLQVRHILLTHGHADHLTGAPELKALTGAPISIHEADAAYTDSPLSLAEQTGYPVVHFQADTLLKEGDTVTFGGETLHVLHTPGHTPGGVCFVHEEEGQMFSGDTLFCMTAGRTDLPGGDTMTLMQSLSRLVALEGDYRVWPGHERPTTLSAERRRNYYLRRLGK